MCEINCNKMEIHLFLSLVEYEEAPPSVLSPHLNLFLNLVEYE